MPWKFSQLFPRSLRWRIKRFLGVGGLPIHKELGMIDFRKGSRIVFDVGANRGNFAATILLGAPLSQVHCFEPNPELFPQLEAKCHSFGMEKGRPRAIPNSVGVGASPGMLELIVTNFAPASSMLPVGQAAETGWPMADFGVRAKVPVPVITLQDYAQETGIADARLLKLDVQGFELEVLKGCGEFLSQIDYVYAEVQFLPLYEGGPLWTDLLRFLSERRFYPEVMGGICLGPSGEPLSADLLWRNSRRTG